MGETSARVMFTYQIIWYLDQAVVYVQSLHKPFGTFALSLVDWEIVVGLTLTISPVLEVVKWMVRHGWFGEM